MYIDYDPYQITSDDEDQTVSLSFNSAGYVTKISLTEEWNESSNDYGKWSKSMSFSYDSDGHLTKASGSEKETAQYYGESETYSETLSGTFTWSAGNMTKLVINADENEDGYKYSCVDTYIYEYSDKANQHKQPLQALSWAYEDIDDYAGALVFIGYFGVGTANLATSFEDTLVFSDEDEEDVESKTMSYTTNSNGTIKTEKMNSTTYTYTYETLETRGEASYVQEYNSNKQTPRHRSLSKFRQRHHTDE